MNARVGNQVGLELVQIYIEGTVESEGSGDAWNNLPNQTVQVSVTRTLDVQIPAADVVDGLVVDHERAIRVLEGGVSGKDGIVRLNHSGGDLRSGVDRELKLGLLAVIDGQPLHQQGSEARSGASTKRVEDEEALKTRAHVGDLADTIKHEVNNLFACERYKDKY